MKLQKYKKGISVFFAVLIAATVCLILPITASAGTLQEDAAKEVAVSDMLPGDMGMARNNTGDSSNGNADGDILDPDNGTVDNDVDHDGGDTSDGMDDSRDTSDGAATSDKDAGTSDKDTEAATSDKDKDTSDKDTTNDLVEDVEEDVSNAGVWGIIIAIIIIVIIIALIFAFVPKRKKYQGRSPERSGLLFYIEFIRLVLQISSNDADNLPPTKSSSQS